jgi:hypothetical protein
MWIDGSWQVIIRYQFGKMDIDVIVIMHDNIQKGHFPIWSAML